MTSHVFETMGTVVSIAFRDAVPSTTVLASIEEEFAAWDERFSLYRPTSEISRIARGEISLMDSSDRFRDIYEVATEWRAGTGGAFTPHRPDGVIDLSGVVKAAAIASAGTLLESAGASGWAINVGGDILTAAEPASRPWLVGLVDPADRGEFLTSVAIGGSRRACATSGTAERGDHIWRSGGPALFGQATVIADDIITADVLATAIISGGAETLDLVCRSWPVDVITVGLDGNLRMTPGALRAMNEAEAVVHSSPAASHAEV